MSQTATLVWSGRQDWEGGWRAEFARVHLSASGLRAAGTQLGINPGPYRLDYCSTPALRDSRRADFTSR